MMTAQHSVFIARQPIFDRKRNVWGYELFFRRCLDDGCAEMADENKIGSQAIIDGVNLALQDVGTGKAICLNIGDRAVADDAYSVLPRESVLLELRPGDGGPEVQNIWEELKRKGYRLVLDGCNGDEKQTPFLKLADVAKINFQNHSSSEAQELCRSAEASGCLTIASEVEDWKQFERAETLGFQCFQGPFFAEPEIVPGRKITSERASLLRLLKVLANENSELEEVLAILKVEPSLVFRLLKYINSPSFGLSAEVESLERAAHLLGVQPLKSWATAAAMAGLESSDKLNELNWASLHRATFLKLLAECNLVMISDPESMFLIGLFSNIDAMMGLPMQEVLNELSLAPVIEQALLGKASPAEWLALLKDLEAGQSCEVQEAVHRLGVSAFKASNLYLQATRLAIEALDSQ